MAAMVMRILAVGRGSHGAVILTRLGQRGWGSYPAESLREAETLLRTFRFEVVLSSEFLPDGRGYELMAAARRRMISLFVAVELSETCLWLPAVDRGSNVLGKRAVHSSALQAELESILAGGSPPAARKGITASEVARQKPPLSIRRVVARDLKARAASASSFSGERKERSAGLVSAGLGSQQTAGPGKEQSHEASDIGAACGRAVKPAGAAAAGSVAGARPPARSD